ncbi:peptide chain release factor N(5)-glutamine methyltransferase [Novosphingobium tardum]|uniref:Release factor glutamine methyltransferase n=1 Tax=Novosphingobium tardum TaxID=1538021 RepID=A0ABV8RLX3_9SPHN
MTVRAALRDATEQLGAVSPSARLDAELLMAAALGVPRGELLLRHLDEAVPAGFAPLQRRRLGHEPIAYILGHAEFYGIELIVTPSVLIPRGDSETLIDAAIRALAGRPPARALDCGTGSGALLIAALAQWPGAHGIGIDRSLGALPVAAANAARAGVGERARILHRDWDTPGWASGLGRFDLVLANPPYVEDEAELERPVREHEPAGALFAGPAGLDAYRRLLPQLPALLAPGGVALVEIGWQQAEAVAAIGGESGLSATVHRDLGNRPRALEFKISLGKTSPSD